MNPAATWTLVPLPITRELVTTHGQGSMTIPFDLKWLQCQPIMKEFSVTDCCMMLKSQKQTKKLHTEFWPLKTKEILHIEQLVWASVKDMKPKYLNLNKDKNNQFHNTFFEHCHSINIAFRLLESKCPSFKNYL